MNENCRAPSGPDVAIAAIASAVPEHRIDQRATRDMVLAIAPELRSHEALFLNTSIASRYPACLAQSRRAGLRAAQSSTGHDRSYWSRWAAASRYPV